MLGEYRRQIEVEDLAALVERGFQAVPDGATLDEELEVRLFKTVLRSCAGICDYPG
jgi:hypothetical protein